MASNGSSSPQHSPKLSPKHSPQHSPKHSKGSAPGSPTHQPAVANGDHAANGSAVDGAKKVELEALQAELASLKLAEEEGEHKTLADKLAELEGEIDHLETETDELRAKEGSNVAKMQSLQEEKKRLEQERETKVESLEADAERLQKQTDEIKHQISAFEKQTRGEESALEKRLETAKRELEAQRSENERRMRDAQNEAGTLPLEEKESKLQAEIEQINVDLEKRTAALAATQAKLDEATDAVENEEQALGNFVNESEQTLTKLKQASKTCQETANSLTAETNRRIDSSSSLKQEIQTIEGAAKINHDKKSDLESAKKGKADKLANLKTQIVDFNSRKYRAEANLSKAEKKAEHCLLEESNRVEKLRKNAAKERTKLAEAQKNAEDLKAQFETQFAQEVARAKAKMTQGKQEELREEKRLLEELRGDNDQQKIRVKALEKAVQQERQKTREINNKNRA